MSVEHELLVDISSARIPAALGAIARGLKAISGRKPIALATVPPSECPVRKILSGSIHHLPANLTGTRLNSLIDGTERRTLSTKLMMKPIRVASKVSFVNDSLANRLCPAGE